MTTKPEVDQGPSPDLQDQNTQSTFDSGQECVPLGIFARLKRQEYMALLAAGFTEQQALFLVKPH